MPNNPKIKFKSGDAVRILSGDDKGKKSVILSINRQKRTAIVEKVNMQTHYIKKDKQKEGEQKGGIIKKEGPIQLSNLMVLDPKTQEPTRIGIRKDKDGKNQRYAKKTGNPL